MDIPLLLASAPGQGPTPAGPSNPGAKGDFALALTRAGKPGADAQALTARGQPATEAGRYLGVAAGGEFDLAPGSREVMMQALGEGTPAEGGDARLAEIAERLALIEGAGRDDATLPADDLAERALDTEALALRIAAIEAAEVPPEAAPGHPPETVLADTGAWPTLAGQALQNAPSDAPRAEARPAMRTERHDSMAGEPPRPERQAAPQALETIRAASERGAAPRPEPLPSAQSTAQATAQAARGDTLPTAAESRSAEPRGESFAALLGGQPSVAAAAGTPGAAPIALPAPLASPAWPQQFTQQVGQQLVMLGQRGGEQRIELHLNPAELGPLTVSLKVSEQAAQAQFLSAHAPVRSAVEQAIPQLREALAEQGISLGEASVGEQSRDGAARDFAGRGMAGGGLAVEPGDESEGPGASAPPVAADIALAGRVDLYA
ncbi:flagellar hook-length control protein FliK [Halomonas sp. LBP4]|uniref:flagellar hook-length control protein FliK n=1 Tax=Halomonas sp. LBP4 TaxID=2044917 RepID=UPI000D750E7C|nr:flagellar hook-length control protein FliK [Halomonas sp. LBP4]